MKRLLVGCAPTRRSSWYVDDPLRVFIASASNDSPYLSKITSGYLAQLTCG